MKAYNQRADVLSLLDRTPEAMGWMTTVDGELAEILVKQDQILGGRRTSAGAIGDCLRTSYLGRSLVM